jgi:hypothetical protein
MVVALENLSKDADQIAASSRCLTHCIRCALRKVHQQEPDLLVMPALLSRPIKHKHNEGVANAVGDLCYTIPICRHRQSVTNDYTV